MNRFVPFIRNYQEFCEKNAELQKFRTQLTELRKSFVVKYRNFCKFPELKKVLYESYETIFRPPNLKSFRRSMPNLKSSVKYLFFLQCTLITILLNF